MPDPFLFAVIVALGALAAFGFVVADGYAHRCKNDSENVPDLSRVNSGDVRNFVHEGDL